MSRPIGLPKSGGRRKGTPNKKTLKLDEILSTGDVSLPERLMVLLPSLEPDKQAQVLLKLMEFIYPKKSAVETFNGPVDTYSILADLVLERNSD